MSVFKRIIAVFLAFSIIISMVTVASAAETDSGSSSLYDGNSVAIWIDEFTLFVGDELGQNGCWSMLNRCLSYSGTGALDGYEDIVTAAGRFNARFADEKYSLALTIAGFGANVRMWNTWAVVDFDSSFGVYRLKDSNTGNWLVNSLGYFPYYCETASAVPDDLKDIVVESTRKDQWIPISSATRSKQVSVLTKDSLSDLCLTLNQIDRTCSVRDTYINKQRFYVIIDTSNNIYANADGVPYVAHYEATVTDEKFDYIVNEGDNIDNSTTIDNSQVIDMSNGTFNYIDESGKQEFFIDELVYDFSSQSYSADTYNVTYDNDVYNTYNYTWNITYNITNTYVTNIGQTELYEPLELYYALPDGRSSADLTAEEVAGMSFEFADCVNYAKSATDTYLRALYHFDGNTDDSSYFSTQGKFEWLSGASISYMDVGTFDGALYLGPEAHSMKITLPSNIGVGDFTLQFRYYQAGEADTLDNIENRVQIGGTTVAQWDDSSISDGTASVGTSLAIGTWQEIAVIRHSGILYLYHNGICISNRANSSSWVGEIVLTLGDTSRAYSMLDELRVVNFAVAENGAAYTCTSVPYDTNSVLVLPDSAFPIADEYWDFKSSKSNYLTLTYDDFASGVISSHFSSTSGSGSYSAPDFRYNSSYVSLNAYPGYLRISTSYPASTLVADYYGTMRYAFSTKVSSRNKNANTIYGTPLLSSIGSYCFSVVLADGTVCSLPFTVGNSTTSATATFDWGTLEYRDYTAYEESFTYCQVAVVPNQNSYVDIIYMELVDGDCTDLTAEWVTCMYSSEEVKPNTAAIQTDVPITGYTVGGVRPTFPARGDVWMPVTGNRISAVYVYNGSAWESVNARWYTGTRWIPIYAFDLTTLQDCWDIADIDSTIVMIGTESQFWAWLQNAWQKMLDKLDAIIIALGGDPNYSPDSPGGGGTGLWDRIKTAFSDALASIIESLMTFITDVLQLVLDLVYDLLSFFFDFLSTEVVTGIANLFSSFTDGSLLVFFQQDITSTDENGNEVTTTVIALPEGIAAAFAFFAGVIMILPDELRNLMIFGVGALILIGILKLAKS